jgi:GH18 family chitinase
MTTMRTLIERLEEAFKMACPPGHKMVFGKCTKVDSRNWKPTRSEVQRETNKRSYKEKLNNRRRSGTTEDQAFDEMDEGAESYGWVKSLLARKGWKDANAGAGDDAYLYDPKQDVLFLFHDDVLAGVIKAVDGAGAYAASNLYYFDKEKAPVIYKVNAKDKKKIMMVDLRGAKRGAEQEISELPSAR